MTFQEKAKKFITSISSTTTTITFPQEYNPWGNILSTGTDNRELEHIVCYGPCRAGKSAGLVIPTLLSWQHSAIITDFTSELWSLTAGYRATVGDVLRFEPSSQSTAHWNPLDEIRIGTDNEISDIQTLCSYIMPQPEDRNGDNARKTALAVLVRLVTHFIYQCRQHHDTPTLPMLANRDLTELFYALCDDNSQALQTPELLAISEALAPYRHPSIAATMSQSDFSVRDLNQGDKPVSLYIVARPWDAVIFAPIFKLLIAMTTHILTDKVLASSAKFTLLGMMDDYSLLKGMEPWQKDLPLMAERGLKFFFITQDINQLNNRCAEEEMLPHHCNMQIAYPPMTLSTAVHMLNLSDSSLSIRDCMSMRPSSITNHGEMLIYTRGGSLIREHQLLYFNDEDLLTRSEIQAPS